MVNTVPYGKDLYVNILTVEKTRQTTGNQKTLELLIPKIPPDGTPNLCHGKEIKKEEIDFFASTYT